MLTKPSSPSSSDGASSSSSSNRHISARGVRVRVEGGACAGTTPCVLFESAPQRNTPSHMLHVTCTAHSQGGPMSMSRVDCGCVMCPHMHEIVRMIHSHEHTATQNTFSQAHCDTKHILTSTLRHRTEIVRMILSHKHTATQNTFMFVWHDRAFCVG